MDYRTARQLLAINACAHLAAEMTGTKLPPTTDNHLNLLLEAYRIPQPGEVATNGRVYILRQGQQVKIGYTANPDQRFRLALLKPDMSATASGLLPTPTRRDGRVLAGSQPPKRAPNSGLPLAWWIATRLGIFKGRLCPTKVGLLMGYPAKVTQQRPTAMRLSPRSRRNSSPP